jgi:arsenate reductase
MAIQVMREIGIDISNHTPSHAYKLINDEWDYLITVCDDAYKEYANYFGKAKHRIHIGFEDPYTAVGSPEHVHDVYVKVRDEIIEVFNKLYVDLLKD